MPVSVASGTPCIRHIMKCFNLFRLQNVGKRLVKAKRVRNGDGCNVYVNLIHISTSDVFYTDWD
jgi:hypothetical protein